MPFFEPLPPEPPRPAVPQPTGWRPPVWDRPSEALLGAPVPAVVLLAKNDEVALVLDHIHAFPNGFACSLAILRNPMAPRNPEGPMGMGLVHPMAGRGPRLGFEFSDGSRAHDPGPRLGIPFPVAPGQTVGTLSVTGRAPGSTNPFGIPTDEQGVPTEPVLIGRGGGGGGERFAIRFWCFPLPPAGTMTVYAEWVDQDIPETSAPLDATLIRDAAARVVTVWDPPA